MLLNSLHILSFDCELLLAQTLSVLAHVIPAWCFV